MSAAAEAGGGHQLRPRGARGSHLGHAINVRDVGSLAKPCVGLAAQLCAAIARAWKRMVRGQRQQVWGGEG